MEKAVGEGVSDETKDAGSPSVENDKDTMASVETKDATTNETNEKQNEPIAENAKDTVDNAATASQPPKYGGNDDETQVSKSAEPTSQARGNEHDHSNRRVMVGNLLKYIKNKDIPKMIQGWLSKLDDPSSVVVTKHKKAPKATWMMLTLEDESMVQPFIELIQKERITNGRGKPLYAQRGESNANKRAREDNESQDNNHTNGDDSRNNNNNNKRQLSSGRTTPSVMTMDQVRDRIVPLWRLSYKDQLQQKRNTLLRKCVLKIVQEIKAKFRTLEREAKRAKRDQPQKRPLAKLYHWLQTHRPIELDTILPSPLQLEYRNKCELTFGYQPQAPPPTTTTKDETAATTAETVVTTGGGDEETKNNDIATEKKKVPSVGFLAAGWSGGVYPPHGCPNVPWEACAVANILHDFLQKSPLPPYDSKSHTGFWRTVTIRSSIRTNQCMIVVCHNNHQDAGLQPNNNISDDDGGVRKVMETEQKRLLTMLSGVELKHVEGRDYGNVFGTESNQETEQQPKRPPLHSPIRVTSIYFQEFVGLSSPTPSDPVQVRTFTTTTSPDSDTIVAHTLLYKCSTQHAYGDTTMEERLGKCTFQISPGAFFQVNTECAEVLYQVVVDKIQEFKGRKTPEGKDPPRVKLLDVCCGTGTIGLTCLKEGVVDQIVGVDISEPAIADAQRNATKNGYNDGENKDAPMTTRFVASRAESVMAQELAKLRKEAEEDDNGKETIVVAVVDPARDGLHPDVVRSIRMNDRLIQRLVYVSCNPTGSLVRDAQMLCGPPTKRYPGQGFRPTSCQPVDMFPLTDHCEMVMVFDRLTQQDMEGKVLN